MPDPKNLIRTLAPYVLSCLSGALLLLSFPPFDRSSLIYIALVPLLIGVSLCRTARSAANLGAITGLILYGVLLHWLHKIFGSVAIGLWCALAVWVALFAALAWRIDRWMIAELGSVKRGLMAAFLLAACWTGVEYFRSEIWWLECPWLALGFSQTPNLPILQTLRIWGVYGLSFYIVLVNNVGYLLIRKAWRPALILGAIALLPLFWAKQQTPRADEMPESLITVALIQYEGVGWEKLASLSTGPGARAADLVVWPEYGVIIPPGHSDAMKKIIAERVRGPRSVTVAAGVIWPELGKGQRENFAWVFSAEGNLEGRTDKRHPVPFVEKGLPRQRSSDPIRTSIGWLGIQICYDLDFEDGSRELARKGAQLLVVPNMDPDDWGLWQHRQHSAMASARAVETGLWIVRAASSGISQIIDGKGRLMGLLPAMRSGVLLGEAHMTKTPPKTFYVTAGWLTGPLCLLLLLAVGGFWIAEIIRSRRKAVA